MSEQDQTKQVVDSVEESVVAETDVVDTADAGVNDADVVVADTDAAVADAAAEEPTGAAAVSDGDSTDEEEVVSAPVSAAEEPVVDEEPTAPVQEVAGPDTVQGYLMSRFKNMAAIPANTATVIQRMEQYVTTMSKSRAMGATAGSDMQRQLFYTFMTALGGPDDSINPSLEAICWFFKKNLNDCFADTHAYRFMNAVKLSKDQTLTLQSLINLFKLVCEPGTRSLATKQIDIARATEKITDLRSRERLVAFVTVTR